MKHPVLALLGLLAVAAAPVAQAVEILRWERMPLAVPLKVGQERIVFINRNVRVGVPAGVGERLRVQSAGGAVYLRASEPIEPTRLQLQDADTGALILLDIAAELPKDGEAELEPVRIVEGDSAPGRYGHPVSGTALRTCGRSRHRGISGRVPPQGLIPISFFRLATFSCRRSVSAPDDVPLFLPCPRSRWIAYMPQSSQQ